MHNPYPSLVNQLIKDRFLINQSIFTNDKTLVYDVLDIKNPTEKLVIKFKLRNFHRAAFECQGLRDL